MSKISTETFECPKCNTKSEFERWHSLNADLSPDAKDKLLAGKLFSVTCPECKTVSQVVYPLLYHDMTRKALIQLVFSEEEAEGFKENTTSVFLNAPGSSDDIKEKAADYIFRAVFSSNELMEKVHIIDSGLDDRIIEIMKLMIQAMASESNPEINIKQLLFAPDSPYRFVIITQGDAFSVEFDMNGYTKIKEAYEDAIEEKSRDCVCIDKEWALGNFAP